ncbi:MAG: hypothetical protein JOY80_10245 [Candidatus Dormibacteraeota bacterium]|nr:hypothetical protein [Candidatus Dormibacteraeota bacterium]
MWRKWLLRGIMVVLVLAGASALWAPRPAVVRAGGDSVGTDNSGVVYNGQAQDFYFDSTTNTLQHAWYAGGWHTETLDGPGASGGNGRTSVNVGKYNSAVVFDGQLQDFYQDTTNNVLRHAVWTGNGWFFESLDGSGVGGGNGRNSDNTAYYNTAVIYNGQVQDYFYDKTGGLLRHAVWGGSAWFFESLDGNGVSGGNGRTSDNVGYYASAVLYNSVVQVFYWDASGLLRHAVWGGGEWFFESLDGNGVSGGNGRTADNVGSYNSAVVYNGQLQDFSWDMTVGVLRHAVWDGSGWFFESLDGATTVSGGNGRTADNVGPGSSAVVYNGQLQDFYYDDNPGGLLRHAVWNGGNWFFESLDGNGVSGGNGRTSDNVGSWDSALLYNGQVQDFYADGTGVLRHTVWNGSTWLFETPAQ